MLYLVLALVVAAFGLLVAALTTQAMVWAWVSVGVSIVAGVVLVVDSVRRRRLAAVPAADDEDEDEEPFAPEADDETLAAEPESAPVAGSGSPPEAASPEPELDDAEPAEEDTDAADVLVVSELEAGVVVLDERPRYHLTSCRWLRDRETIPLPVKEARELGFTPCGVCTPDRKLAARHRRDGRVSAD